MMQMNRRKFLKALGLTGAAYTLGGLPQSMADSSTPKRLLVVSTGQGTVYDGWKMNPAAMPADAFWDTSLAQVSREQFSQALMPLYEHRRRLTVLDGISMASPELDIPGYRHEKGWIHAWTGNWAHLTGSQLLANSPSLDQLVARQIQRGDRLPSLDLRVADGRPVCHAGRAQQIPLEHDPRRAWERLFGLAQSADPLLAARGSVLDYALDDYDALRSKLGGSDRQRLEQHFELVRQLERRIGGL